MNGRASSRLRAFTLVEIMIVVLVVGVLSTLALFVIGRIKDRAVRSIIENNLRQLYQAKEFSYAQSGSREPRTVMGLVSDGYLKRSTGEELRSSQSIVGHAGWRYSIFVWPDQPVYAYQGTNVAEPQLADRATPVWKSPTGAVIWYPGPPTGDAPAAAVAANPAPPSAPAVPTLKQPGQTGTISIESAPFIWEKTDWWLQRLGVVSPDGSPMTITEVRSDPPSFGNFRGTNGQYTQFDFSNPGQAGQATLYVTVENASGKATIPVSVKTGN